MFVIGRSGIPAVLQKFTHNLSPHETNPATGRYLDICFSPDITRNDKYYWIQHIIFTLARRPYHCTICFWNQRFDLDLFSFVPHEKGQLDQPIHEVICIAYTIGALIDGLILGQSASQRVFDNDKTRALHRQHDLQRQYLQSTYGSIRQDALANEEVFQYAQRDQTQVKHFEHQFQRDQEQTNRAATSTGHAYGQR